MIFVSSAFTGDEALQELRARVREWATETGTQVWLFEQHPESWWKNKSFAASAHTCLTALQQSHLYVGFFHDAYGGSGRSHRAGIALTDLEVFHAVRLRIPMLLYVVEPSRRDSSTAHLLTVMQQVVPRAFRGVGSCDEISRWLHDDLRRYHERGNSVQCAPIRLGRLLDRTTKFRWQEIASIGGLATITPTCSCGDDISPTTARDLISTMRSAASAGNHAAEATLSAVYSMIAEIPWTLTDSPNLLTVWDTYCKYWLGATVWHDNHNAERLGCVATLNAQVRIRCAQAMEREVTLLDILAMMHDMQHIGSREWLRVYGLCGSLASAHYSLAKVQRGHERRQFLAERSVAWTEAGQKISKYRDDRGQWEAHLASIRGHAFLLLSDLRERAADEFRRSLELRRACGASDGSIGEAKGDLGELLFIRGDRSEGVALLREAVDELTASMREGFTARIKLKLAHVLLRSGRLDEAIRHVSEADAICRHHGIDLRQPAGWRARMTLRGLRVLGNRRRPRVIETPTGYQFEY